MTTSTSTKITNRTALEYAIKVINNDDSWCDVYNPAEIVDKLEKMIENLDKRATTPRKPTPTQVENEGFKEAITAFLYGVEAPQTIKEIVANVEGLSGLSNQRVTHLLTALRKAGAVKRTVVKKVPYYEYGVEEGYTTEEEEG